jgi:hypothetical protein
VADSPRETLALARTAAGAVRSLNHATLGGDGLGQPADAYELIGELSLAAAGLPQLLAQVGRWLASVAAALGQAQQQIAAVHGGPAPEEGERP